MATMNPSPTKPVVRYPTALLEDKELVTIHDSRLPDYKALEYGTLYPDQNKFPGLKLIFQEPLEDDRMVRRVWAGDRKDQDLYNADRKYSGGSTEHPILIRRYLFPEDGYEPLPTGTPDSQFPEAVLVEEEVAQPENRNGYLAVTRVFETLPGPLLTGVQITEKGQIATITTQVVEPGTTVTPSALVIGGSVKPDSKGKSVLEKIEVPEVFSEKSFSIENPDPVPQKFRISAPATVEEETVAGTAVKPTLRTGELAKSEQQLTKFTKRKRKTSRSKSSLPKSLVQTRTYDKKITGTLTETLRVRDTNKKSTATTLVNSEAIGDGTYVVSVDDTVEVFKQPLFASEVSDPIPEKFKSGVITEIQESTSLGTAKHPTLDISAGETSKSEEQIDKFLVRTRRVKRNRGLLKNLTSKRTDESSGLVTVVETLGESQDNTQPSATTSVFSEQLGPSLYLNRRETSEFFPQPVFSVESSDANIPEKFKATLHRTVEEKTVIGTAGVPSLNGGIGELEASEAQVTKFSKRTRRVVRKGIGTAQSKLSQKRTNEYGQLVEIDESLANTDTSITPSAKVSVESENIGGGRFVTRISKVKNVFEQKQLSARVEDVLPERFKASLPVISEERSIEGKVEKAPSLGVGDILQSESQVTEFVKRVRSEKREPISGVTLSGVEYDAESGGVTRYTERIIAEGEPPPDQSEVTPISDKYSLARTYEVGSPTGYRDFVYPSSTSISFPDRLVSARVVWCQTQGGGATDTQGGSTYSVHNNAHSATVGDVALEIEAGFSGLVPTSVWVFYTNSSIINKMQVLARTGSREWPAIKMKSESILILGGSYNETFDTSTTTTQQGTSRSNGNSSSITPRVSVVNLPPTLHGSVTVRDSFVNLQVVSKSVSGKYSLRAPKIPGNVEPRTLGATNPVKFPTGNFLRSVSVAPVKHGVFRVTAEVVHVTSDYV